MAGNATAFGRGMLIGAGAALLYAAARGSAVAARRQRSDREASRPADSHDRTYLVDWRLAERVAVSASGDAPTLHPATRERLREAYQALLGEIETPIAAYTGHELPLQSTAVEVMDRPAWIRANMQNFRVLLEPVEAYYRESAREDAGAGAFDMAQAVAQQAARVVVSTQLGLLVGYLSRRVLGQYDLSLLGREPIVGGTLYFVEPNIRHVSQTLGLPLDEFRRWIALHEATHAHEFELHPWVREYLNTTLRSYLRLLIEDMRRQSREPVLVALANRLAGGLRSGHNLLLAMMTPQQRDLMSRLQALMSLAEGYSNHVMNAVGRSLLPGFETIHERVEHRQRERSRAEVLFLRLTGLSMKMEQYRRGEQFVDYVTRARGISFANRAWQSPELLPTEAEIAQPERWITRVEAGA